MRCRIIPLATVGLLLVAGAPVIAQSVQTGSIIGVVRDGAGRPLAGAKIRARSAQTERNSVSNEKGEFRLPLLNVGEWVLTVDKDTFQSHTVKTRVEMNETRIANFSLPPIKEAVVEVVAKPGEMDTTATQVATSVSAQQLALIPANMTSLNPLDGLMGAVPGVQVAYSGNYNVMGGTDDQNLFTVDGTVTNRTNSNKSDSTQTPREFIESVEVVTNAFGAEYGVFGGVINSLTKSGNNKYEGSVFYATNFPNAQAVAYYNPDTTPPQKKPGDFHKYNRYGAFSSGPMLKDKVFYFIGFQGYKDEIPPSTLLNGGLNWNGLKSDNASATGPNQWTAKINWFINTENQLILSGTRSSSKTNTGHQYVDYGTMDNGITSESVTQSINLTWNWLPMPNLFVVASVGNFKNPSSSGPNSGATFVETTQDGNYFIAGPGATAPNKPANPAYVTYITGTGNSVYTSQTNPNTQYRLDLTWNVGNHQVKAGYLRQDTYWERTEGAENAYIIGNQITSPTGYTMLQALRWTSNYSKYDGLLQSFYVKDVVEILPGLRMDVGVRYDPIQYKGAFVPYDGMTLAEYRSPSKQLQPRLGLVWDVDQDGKKKVFAHFGRYFMTMPMSGITWAKTGGIFLDMWFPGSWTYNTTYANDRAFTLVKPTPDMTLQLTGGTGKPKPHATELRLPRKDSMTFGADWTFGKNWTAGGVWTFWELKDVIEDSYFLNADGSAAFSGMRGTKVIWNPGPGAVTFLDSNGVQRTWNSNFPNPKDRYIGLNLHATNLGERHYIALDYTWTHHYGNYLGESQNQLTYLQSGQLIGTGAGGTTTDFDYARGIASGNYEGNPVHEFKVRGGYRHTMGKHDLNVGFTLNWQTGLGQTTVMTAGGKWQQNASDTSFGGLASDIVTTNNQRGNMGNTPSLFQVNLDISGMLRFKGFSVKPNLVVSNLFNQRTVLGYYQTPYTGNYIADLKPNPNLGLIYTKLAGRALSAGISVQF